jgi:hypothetical protein
MTVGGQHFNDPTGSVLGWARQTRSSGDIGGSVAWAETSSAVRLTVPATAGGLLVVTFGFLMGYGGSLHRIDVATQDASHNPIGWLSSNGGPLRAHDGLPEFYLDASFRGTMGPVSYSPVSGDIVTGVVELGLWDQEDTGTSKILANSNYPFEWSVVSYG